MYALENEQMPAMGIALSVSLTIRCKMEAALRMSMASVQHTRTLAGKGIVGPP